MVGATGDRCRALRKWRERGTDHGANGLQVSVDPERKVFTIGYNVLAQRQTTLRSAGFEARRFRGHCKRRRASGTLVSLGRQLTSTDGGRALIS